ncbi:hypothetical protein KF840_25650 [bacterium]|nr:hypothetical protein [bacterium]
MRRALAAVMLLALHAPTASAQQDVGGQIQHALQLVESAVEQSLARALPLPAPSAGVSYSFDAATGNFQRDPSTFGQVYLERADPLGRGRVNVSLMYQYVNLAKIDGYDSGDLRTADPIPIPDALAAVALPSLSFSANVQQVLLAASYGITDALEASLAVPIVYSHIAIDAPVSGAAVTPGGELVLIDERVSMASNDVGVGDVFLRGKYRLADLSDVHLAAGLLLRLPAGDVDQLQGIGFVELTPAFIASTRVFQPAPWARLQGHFNGAIAIDTEDVGNSEARWGFGFDWGVTESLTAGIALLAQNQFAGVAPAGTFTIPRCQSDLVTCATNPAVRMGTQQLYGLSTTRPDYYDFAIGGRGALWRDTIFAFANVAIPLNDGFVRTDPIPLVGLEATF